MIIMHLPLGPALSQTLWLLVCPEVSEYAWGDCRLKFKIYRPKELLKGGGGGGGAVMCLECSTRGLRTVVKRSDIFCYTTKLDKFD